MQDTKVLAGHRWHFTVIVGNHNQGIYLREALDSVVGQTTTDWQLIVVDDGSVDHSREILGAYEDARITVIEKNAGGMLSCYNAALPHIRGAIVCLLDPADAYEPGYLDALSKAYGKRRCDFVFCNMRLFGTREGRLYAEKEVVKIGESHHLVRHSLKHIGGPCSGMSMTARLFAKVLPLADIEGDWIADASLPLSWGASIHYGVKRYEPECLVRHRVHAGNDTMIRRRASKPVKAKKGKKPDKRLLAAGGRYLARFPRSLLLLDFLGVLREFFRSPAPGLYEDVLRKRLWIFGGILAKTFARMKRHSDIFDNA